MYEGVWTLEDGAQLAATAAVEGENVEFTFSNEELEIDIVGTGQAGDDGLLTGKYEGEVFGERVTGRSWTAMPISDDGEDAPPSEPGDDEDTPEDADYAFTAQYNGETLEGELELELVDVEDGVAYFEGGLKLPQNGGTFIQGSARVEGENVTLELADVELDTSIAGRGQFNGNGLIVGSFEGTLLGTVVTDGEWTATPALSNGEPGEDPAPPSDPGDGEAEPGTVRVDITVESEDVSGTVTIERVENDETEVVASSEFASSGQGSSASQTIEQTLEPGDYTLRIAIDGFDSNNVIPFELEPGEDETFNLIV